MMNSLVVEQDQALSAAQRRAIREGQALHAVLEHPEWVPVSAAVETALPPRLIQRRFAAFGLAPPEGVDLWHRLCRLMQDPAVRELLVGSEGERAAGVERLAERSWPDGRGSLVRPDLVVCAADRSWLRIIDFKRSLPAERLQDYRQQVADYVSILQARHPQAEVTGWLLSVEGERVRV